MDTRTPARVLSYKLTLWAFGSGELKTWDKQIHVLSLPLKWTKKKSLFVLDFNERWSSSPFCIRSVVSDFALCVIFCTTMSNLIGKETTGKSHRNFPHVCKKCAVLNQTLQLLKSNTYQLWPGQVWVIFLQWFQTLSQDTAGILSNVNELIWLHNVLQLLIFRNALKVNFLC